MRALKDSSSPLIRVLPQSVVLSVVPSVVPLSVRRGVENILMPPCSYNND